ncbi:MAG: class A beta-lactamase [Flavobacteriales bacterium]
MRSICVLLLAASLCACSDTPSVESKSSNVIVENSNQVLRDQITQIVSGKKADIGVAIIGPSGDTLSIHGDQHFPMMSVAKFPQALALLHMVDEGKMKIDEKLHFTAEDLKQRTFSTLPKDHPEKEFDLSIAEALGYAVGQSDNVTSNVIFAKEGGPKAVEDYVHSLGISDIGIAVDYWHLNDSTAPSNWSTPKAMALMLQKYFAKEILKEDTHNLLWNAMTNGPSGAKRLKYLLPTGTVVAHKTGTGNTDDATGKIFALNDVGIIVLPGGKPICLAVFTANSFETEEVTEDVMAQIGKAVYTFYASK